MADRYPFAPLEALILVDVGPRIHGNGQDVGRTRLVAEVLGVHQRQVIRWRAIGVTADQADRLAVAAHRHAFEVWPELADRHLVEAETAEAVALARKRQSARESARRRYQDPERRALLIERSRRYRASSATYVRAYRKQRADARRAQSRASYERNRARLLQARRDRYHSDPEYRATVLARQRERYWRLRDSQKPLRTKNKNVVSVRAKSVGKKGEYIDYKDVNFYKPRQMEGAPAAEVSTLDAADDHRTAQEGVTCSADAERMENAA